MYIIIGIHHNKWIGSIKEIQSWDNIRPVIADIVCTLSVKSSLLKSGAKATNTIEAHDRNAKN